MINLATHSHEDLERDMTRSLGAFHPLATMSLKGFVAKRLSLSHPLGDFSSSHVGPCPSERGRGESQGESDRGREGADKTDLGGHGSHLSI